jgi:glycosyltransferase involved in cell wall biosynthesis
MAVRVSVIIPAYNASKTIVSAISSVFAQTFDGDVKIIVIDDGSTDDTRAIVSDMTLGNRQIVLLSNERKKGPSGARNTGLLRADGNYVAFLDADDIWLPDHLDRGVSFLEQRANIDVVFFNCDIVEYRTKRRIGDWFSSRNFLKKLRTDAVDDEYYLIRDDMFDALLEESFMHLQSMIVRAKVLDNIFFNEDVKRSEDRDFSIKLYATSGAKFAFKNVITGTYFQHEDSLTAPSVENSRAAVSDQIKLFTGYLSSYSLERATIVKLKKLIFDRYMASSYYNRKLNNHRLAFKYLLNSFAYGASFAQFAEFWKIIYSYAIQRTTRSG